MLYKTSKKSFNIFFDPFDLRCVYSFVSLRPTPSPRFLTPPPPKCFRWSLWLPARRNSHLPDLEGPRWNDSPTGLCRWAYTWKDWVNDIKAGMKITAVLRLFFYQEGLWLLFATPSFGTLFATLANFWIFVLLPFANTCLGRLICLASLHVSAQQLRPFCSWNHQSSSQKKTKKNPSSINPPTSVLAAEQEGLGIIMIEKRW